MIGTAGATPTVYSTTAAHPFLFCFFRDVCPSFRSTHCPHPRREDMSVGTVIVAHQISRRRCQGKRLGDLPGQPLGSRMPRHLEPKQLSPAMAQDQKRKQEIKGQGRNDAHIDCGDRLSVISEKCLPCLRRRLRKSHHIFRDRRLGHLKAKHQKLAMDPGRAPQRVFPAYPLDKITQATVDLRPPCPISGFPTPEHFKTSAMPPQNGFRLNYWAMPSRLGQNRVIHMSSARSLPHNRRRGGARLNAMLS